MAQTFPGTFAGKMAFCSAVTDGPRYYLTTCQVSDGGDGWIYWPGMNAPSVTDTEKFILYLYADGYYRIQSGDLRWLAFNEAGKYIEYGDDLTRAAPFLIQGNPFGSQLSLHTTDGDRQVFYMLQKNQEVTNVLSLTGGSGHYGAFAPTYTTPSLEAIRQQKQAVKADFANVILQGQDLSQGINFTEANFKGAQLAGVNFSGATLDRADLSKTDLRGLNWGSPASAVKINLTGSNCSGCTLGGQEKPLNCTEAILSSANFTGAKLNNLNLQNADLSGAILNRAVLDKASLNFAKLIGVVASKASFIGAVLTDAKAQMGIFTRAVFDNATLTRVSMDASSYLFKVTAQTAQLAAGLDDYPYPRPELISAFQANGVKLKDDSAVEIVIKGERWLIHDPKGPYKLLLTEVEIQVFNEDPSLIPASLRGASLVGTLAPSASLSGADLRGVRWYAAPASLSHADLEDAVLTGALLVSADFTQANVSGADFSNSVLIQGKFMGCIAGPGGNRRAISFEGAHLEGVDFSKATFSGALLTDAVVALDSGVPLLFLPLEDQQYLTTAGLSTLSPAFHNAGFDLGSTPAVKDNTTWEIDNSESKNQQAPKLYSVARGGAGFQVSGNGKYLFQLLASAAPLLDKDKASQPLVNMFTPKNYNLVLNAPITKQKSWIINPSGDAAYLRPYRFPTMLVKAESARLTVYGRPPVMIEDLLTRYPQGVAFNATQNLGNALSQNSVGPAGVPFSWVGEGMDEETFFTAVNI
jgi:uncharacterized protein YjbI with pentapeptide repeats